MPREDFEILFSELQTHYLQQNFAVVLSQGKFLLAHEDWQAWGKLDEAAVPVFALDDFLKEVAQASSHLAWVQSPYLNVLLWCADSAHTLGHIEEAHLFLDQALDFSPQAALWHLKARWLQAQGQTQQAIIALAQALKQDRTYIAAYEDLVTLANTVRLPELTFEILQQASQVQMTSRLLSEWLLLSSDADFVEWRSLFIELCVQQLQEQTVDMLCEVLRHLARQDDDYHCTYLGFHLLSYGVRDESVRQIYVLSALRQHQPAQVLQLLLRWSDFERDALYFYHVGQGFLCWQMPRFARDFFVAGLRKVASEDSWYPILKKAHEACEKSLEDEDFLKSCLKRFGVDPAFKAQFQKDPRSLLAAYQVTWSASWQRLWKMLGGAVIS